MGIFDINLRNINWKTFNIMEVVEGCKNFTIRNLTLSDEYKEMAEYRLNICKGCELMRNNICFKDWKDEKDERKVDEIAKEKFDSYIAVTPENAIKKKWSVVREQERQNYILDNKVHTVHKGVAYVGCGCMLNCKTFNPHSNCPAKKWESVKIA